MPIEQILLSIGAPILASTTGTPVWSVLLAPAPKAQ
jgi:hypothetical protein